MKYGQASPEERMEFVAALRELADWLESTPEAPLERGQSVWVSPWGAEKDDITALATTGGKFEKKYIGDQFALRRKFGATADISGAPVTYSLETSREEVCTKRVIGTEMKPVKKYVDTGEMQAVEIVEWDCNPLLAAD